MITPEDQRQQRHRDEPDRTEDHDELEDARGARVVLRACRPCRPAKNRMTPPPTQQMAETTCRNLKMRYQSMRSPEGHVETGDLMIRCVAATEKARRSEPSRLPSRHVRLRRLALAARARRDGELQPVELVAQQDLAAQPRVRLLVERREEEVLLVVARLGQLLEPASPT